VRIVIVFRWRAAYITRYSAKQEDFHGNDGALNQLFGDNVEKRAANLEKKNIGIYRRLSYSREVIGSRLIPPMILPLS
jgi:hypothetical protein